MITRYVILMLVLVLSIVIAEISQPKNAKVTTKPLQETSAVIITWDAPISLGNSNEEDIQYSIQYCEINKKQTCKNTTQSTERRVEITNLKKNLIYNYHIYPFGKDNEVGKEYNSIFRTALKRTCLPNKYTCAASDQCIDPRKKCDGIISCRDSSDEDANAGCGKPVNSPSDVKVENVNGTSSTVVFRQVPLSDRVTSYEIEIIDTSSKNTSTFSVKNEAYSVVARSKIIPGLSPNTKYRIRALAVNRVGKGPWSDEVTFTTLMGPPGDVTGVDIIPVPLLESSAAKLQWKAPTELNSHDVSSLKYEVQYCKLNFPDTCKRLPKTKELSATMENLTKNSFYQYKITVYDSNNQTSKKPYENFFQTKRKNSCASSFFRCTFSDQCIFTNRTCNGIPDCGDSSDERLDAECKPPLNAPKNLKVVKKTSSSFELTWDPVPLRDRPQLYILRVEGENVQTKKIQTGFAARVIEATVENLLPNREYSIKVRAVNPVGTGQYSEPLKEFTEKVPKGEALMLPQSARETPVPYKESTSVVISWSPPKDLRGNDPKLVRYNVLYCSINTKCDKSTPKSLKTNATLLNLLPAHIYQYTVQVFNANNELGPNSSYTHIFTTPKTNTCKNGYFACTRKAQCVLKSRTCNGIVDCRDATDEHSTAGCSVPRAILTPTIDEVSETSITVVVDKVTDLSQRVNRYQVQNVETNEVKTVSLTGFSVQRSISVVFDGLVPGTKYTFRSRPMNPSGTGSWSELIEQVTAGEKPVGLATDKPFKTESTQPSATNPTTKANNRNANGSGSSSGGDGGKGLTTAQKAGIAIGIILAVIIIVVAVIMLLKMKNGNRKETVSGVSNSAYEMEKHP